MAEYKIPSWEQFISIQDILILYAKDKFYETSNKLAEIFPQASLDFSKRPFVKTATALKDWIEEEEEITDDDISTLYLTDKAIPDGEADITGNGPYFLVIYTPILDNGTIKTPDEMQKYLDSLNCASVETILESDTQCLILKVIAIPNDQLENDSWYEDIYEQEWFASYNKIKEENLIAALYLMRNGELKSQNHLS